MEIKLLFLAGISTLLLSTQDYAADNNPLYHSYGGFSIMTPENVKDAAADGIEYTILYGHPAPSGSAWEKALKENNISEVDGFISSNLYYHECYREHTVKKHDGRQFCPGSYPPGITEEVLLQKITAHLQDVQKNYPMVKGFWVLDDQPAWDNGYAKPLLAKIHSLVHYYSPGRPTICGFGGALSLKGHPQPDQNLTRFNSFSPEICDMMALYIYAPSQPVNKPMHKPDEYDWSMADVLPQQFKALKERGWNPEKQPLVGIAQAWGGARKDLQNTFYEITPSVENMKTQSAAFCNAGAISLVFYGWTDSNSSIFPYNSDVMHEGVKEGVKACKDIWKTKK